MRYTKIFGVILAGIMFTLFCSPLYCARDNTPKLAAIVIKTFGKVEYREYDKNKWGTLTESTLLNQGDTIKTGKQSKVMLSFINGIDVKLGESSEMSIDLTKFGHITEGNSVSLTSGRAWMKLSRKQTGFEIHTPLVKVTLTGAEIETLVSPKGKTEVLVFYGKVELQNEHGKQELNRDMQSQVVKGKPPSVPQPVVVEQKRKWYDDDKAESQLMLLNVKPDLYVNESVLLSVQAMTLAGSIDKTYTDKVFVTVIPDKCKFSTDDGLTWKDSLALALYKGQAQFLVKPIEEGKYSVSVAGKDLRSDSAVIKPWYPPIKELLMKIRKQDGTEKEVKLRFSR
ncbi:MAG: FecR family protein [Elusimicrobiota bacterium]